MPARQRPRRATPTRIPSLGVIFMFDSFTGISGKIGDGRDGWRIDSPHTIVRPFSGSLRRFPVVVRSPQKEKNFRPNNRELRRKRSGSAAARSNTDESNREQEMPKFRVVTPKGASFTVAGGGYDYEREALDLIGAEIVEAPANEAEFIAAAKTADAIYAKGMPITKAVI